MKHITYLLAAAGACMAMSQASASAATVDLSKLPAASTKAGVTYATDIAPVIKASCGNCHTGPRPKGGLSLESLEGILKGSKEGKVVKAGDGAGSDLVIAVSQLDPEKSMPPKPRRRGPGGPGGGPGGPGGGPGGPGGGPPGGPEAGPGPGGPGGGPGGPGGGPGGPGGGRQGPPAKALTPEQVGLVRAWIDQGAK